MLYFAVTALLDIGTGFDHSPDFRKHAVAVCLAIETFIDEKHIEETDEFFSH
jgi:hypothetical protein